MAFELQADQEVTLTAAFVDAQGNPTNYPMTYSVDSEATLAVTDNGDGTAKAVAGTLGTANVTSTTTNPDGTTAASTPLEIDVIAGDAVSGTITPGTPTNKSGGAAPVEAPVETPPVEPVTGVFAPPPA